MSPSSYFLGHFWDLVISFVLLVSFFLIVVVLHLIVVLLHLIIWYKDYAFCYYYCDDECLVLAFQIYSVFC